MTVISRLLSVCQNLVHADVVIKFLQGLYLLLTHRPRFKTPQVGVDEARCKSWVTMTA
jgi:hypothetical protein